MTATDCITWPHNGGVCKLIQLDRNDIDEGSDESDPWELLWIDSGNVRRFEIVLDAAYGRLGFSHREDVMAYLAGAPEEARQIVDEAFGR